jgi:cell division septation protein DedD
MNKKNRPARSKPGTEKRSRREAIAKAALCTLVCLWMFILGLLVGRGTAPIRFDIQRLQDELAALKTATIEETTQRYRVAFQELDREMDLGFHEALKDEETDLAQALLPPASDAPASTPPADVQETEVPKKTKASNFQKPETRNTPLPWTIQVAATQDQTKGNQLVGRLEEMGFPAYIVKKEIPGKGTWFRIRVGGYPSREAAEADLGRLKKERFSPMIVSP